MHSGMLLFGVVIGFSSAHAAKYRVNGVQALALSCALTLPSALILLSAQTAPFFTTYVVGLAGTFFAAQLARCDDFPRVRGDIAKADVLRRLYSILSSRRQELWFGDEPILDAFPFASGPFASI